MIRIAIAEDWSAIWPTFQQIVVAGDTYAIEPEISSAAARELWLAPPPNRVVVYDARAEHDPSAEARILGTARMGPNRPANGAHIGTASFMVSPEARGLGVGRALAEWVIQWHRTQGFLGIQFNAVVETNTAAVRLWHDLGFRIVGTVPRAFRSRSHGYVGLHVMFLSLED